MTPSIMDILTARGIDLGRRHGREHRTCCPVHGGENPSAFSYSESLWTCFACGAGGDALALIAALDGVDRATVARELRDRPERLSFRERSERRRRARDRDQAAQRRATRQAEWLAAVRRRDDLAADVALCERIWQRDQGERSGVTRRALDTLAELHLKRDQAEAEIWERAALCANASR